MIYSSCPTCGFFIGNLVEDFEKSKNEICSDIKVTEEEQEQKISQLLKNLKVRRYCCRMRMISFVDQTFIMSVNRHIRIMQSIIIK